MSDITLGIIGSGQLGSLLCQAAKKLNIKTVIISDDQQGPAQNYSDQFIFAKYDNKDKIKEFIFSYEWSKGDICLWDNLSILHMASEIKNCRRVMHRITIK